MKILLFGVWLSFSSDAATTHYALANKIGREGFLKTQNPWIIDAVEMDEAAAMTIGLRRLEKNHPKMLRIIGWTIVASKGFVVANNVQQLRKR